MSNPSENTCQLCSEPINVHMFNPTMLGKPVHTRCLEMAYRGELPVPPNEPTPPVSPCHDVDTAMGELIALWGFTDEHEREYVASVLHTLYLAGVEEGLLRPPAEPDAIASSREYDEGGTNPAGFPTMPVRRGGVVLTCGPDGITVHGQRTEVPLDAFIAAREARPEQREFREGDCIRMRCAFGTIEGVVGKVFPEQHAVGMYWTNSMGKRDTMTVGFGGCELVRKEYR